MGTGALIDPLLDLTKFQIEPLAKRHDRVAFSCSNGELNRYLKTVANQDMRKMVTVVYVATPDRRNIAGYYSLSQYSVDLSSLPDEHRAGLPKYPQVPATLLGRLAVDQRYQGIGLGGLLLANALKRSFSTASAVGSATVVADAKDDAAKLFYLHHGFVALPEFPNRVVLPMSAVQRILPR